MGSQGTLADAVGHKGLLSALKTLELGGSSRKTGGLLETLIQTSVTLVGSSDMTSVSASYAVDGILVCSDKHLG